VCGELFPDFRSFDKKEFPKISKMHFVVDNQATGLSTKILVTSVRMTALQEATHATLIPP
jgi:hypothetical protein